VEAGLGNRADATPAFAGEAHQANLVAVVAGDERVVAALMRRGFVHWGSRVVGDVGGPDAAAWVRRGGHVVLVELPVGHRHGCRRSLHARAPIEEGGGLTEGELGGGEAETALRGIDLDLAF